MVTLKIALSRFLFTEPVVAIAIVIRGTTSERGSYLAIKASAINVIAAAVVAAVIVAVVAVVVVAVTLSFK